MALTGPDKALLGIFDRWAYQKEFAIQGDDGSGTDVWTRIDAAADETFENRCKGQAATDVDTALAAMPLGDINELGPLMDDIGAYCKTDLALGGLNGYLTARRFRMDLRTAQMFQDRYSAGYLSIANIASRADCSAAVPGLELGHFVGNGAGAGAFTAGTDMSETTNGPSPIWARVTVKGLLDWGLTVTCKHATGVTPTTEAVVIVVAASAPVGTTYIVGETLQDENNASGQKVVKVTAPTAQFAAGQKVLVTQWTGDAPNRVWAQQEVGTIATIQEDISLTLVDNLLHSYTTAGNRAYVYPLYIGVSTVGTGAGGNGTNGDTVYFYPVPDRVLAL